jgi:hypothetical protein
MLSNGNAINRSMERLHEVDARDYNVVKGAQTALEAGDMSLFNRQLAQAEVYDGEQRSLQDQVQSYRRSLTKPSNGELSTTCKTVTYLTERKLTCSDTFRSIRALCLSRGSSCQP